MGGNHTFVYLIAGIVLLHFLLGIGWLLYKIMGGGSKKRNDNTDSSD